MAGEPKTPTAEPDPAASPRALPRGPHGLPREIVLQSQRRRMLEAIVAAVAASGYADTSVADVIKRAGVSRTTFYEQFSDKEECFLAAYTEGAELHYRHVAGVSRDHDDDPVEVLRQTIRAYLGALAVQPDFARALLVEVSAAGEGARLLHERFVDRYVQLFASIHASLRESRPGLHDLPTGILRAVMAGIDVLVVAQLREGGAADLPALESVALYLELSVVGLPDARELSGLARDVA